jgi:hypothetical protein
LEMRRDFFKAILKRMSVSSEIYVYYWSCRLWATSLLTFVR